MSSLLLDSSLITESNLKNYNCKIIRCGDYNQVYIYDINKIKKDPFLLGVGEEKKIKTIEQLELFKEKNISRKDEIKYIEYRNILRSKFSMQRLAKSNEKDFKTFITLTFADNISSIDIAQKIFHSWTVHIRQLKNDFKYIAVPEFQKRGAVHYHLLTNLTSDKKQSIITPQKDRKGCFDIKGWYHGFARVDNLKNIDVVAYLSKYMTKDCDNRLWGHRRYYNSRNLVMPYEEFLDLSDKRMNDYFINLIKDNRLMFNSQYTDLLSACKITFLEYKT